MSANISPLKSKSPWRLRWTPLLLAGILCLWPVFHVGGFKDVFTYFNAVPIVISFIMIGFFRFSIPTTTFGVVCAGFITLVHLAWIFDWGETRTGSSTAGVIFIFIPFYAILFGGIAAGFSAWLECKIVSRSKLRH